MSPESTTSPAPQTEPQRGGRRERNKQEKLQRIISAASELFAESGVDEVTTQQIARKADIGTGTLFLYAKTKGELLLMVHNAHYVDALEEGKTASAKQKQVLDAVMAVITPIVECNRAHVENGRIYLREMVFGDPGNEHHGAALHIVGQTEQLLAEILTERGMAEGASTMAHVIVAIMFLELAPYGNRDVDNGEIIRRIQEKIAVVLGI